MKNVKSNKISEAQLQVLLGYAEEDIYDQSRQATAFGLLKVTGEALVGLCCFHLLSSVFNEHVPVLQAILSRKLVVPEMEEVMKKVAKLSVTGSNAMIRIHCRQVPTCFFFSLLHICIKILTWNILKNAALCDADLSEVPA